MFAQEPMKATKWQKISCSGIEQINIDSACETGSNQYIISVNENNPFLRKYNLYKFEVYKFEATLELAYENLIDKGYNSPYFSDETTLYFYSHPRILNKLDLTDKENIKKYTYISENGNIDCWQGRSFLIGNDHYFLSHEDKKLYLTILREPATPGNEGSMFFISCGNNEFLTYAPLDFTSIVVLKDTLYYFSDSGFCSVKIDETTIVESQVSCVTATNQDSLLVTNKQDTIWIINPTDGVIEYNTKNNTAKTIDICPLLGNDTRIDLTAVAFYSKDYLYFIANNEVYARNLLDVPEPPTPNPRKPRMPWIGPITPTIEGGYEFTGLAEFFAMLNDSYLSIMCNGMPMMFTFDPIMHAFHFAPKAPHFDPANSNNAFMNDKYFYIYNPDRNTITCTDTKTGMAQEIACYETMPEDIIQVVVANNLFYILTKSGENHIARMTGANLEYVSSWKLDNWTPRTGASIVAMKNAIYVFGGKALSEDSKEEPSNACYNELYVYDFETNASEKLEVSNDVTARYNAKMLSSKRWGKLWIIGGKDSTDSLALDIWEYNTRNKEWSYINDIPSKDFNASANYEEKYDNLSLLLTPKANTEQSKFFSMRSNTRNIFQASSGAVVYQIKDLSTATSTKSQSGKSCGCLGIEFLLALAGLFILRTISIRNA